METVDLEQQTYNGSIHNWRHGHLAIAEHVVLHAWRRLAVGHGAGGSGAGVGADKTELEMHVSFVPFVPLLLLSRLPFEPVVG